ncbi:MAG: LemA family protein [Armatimonadia bacterium]
MDASVMLVVGIIVLAPLVYIVAAYNRLVRLRATVKESWADVDTELRRRHDLIPNLVETVKGYAAHERAIMDNVVRAREAALTLSNQPAALAQQENVLAQALKSLLAIAENYPDLKASQNFKELQQELANTEDRIQAARRFYNANVRENNIAVQSFPSSVVAGMFGFGGAEFFEIEDAAAREPVTVSFG